MTKGIKVWIPVEVNGAINLELTRLSAKDAQDAASSSTGVEWHFLAESGFWTVEPCTLTKGHGDE